MGKPEVVIAAAPMGHRFTRAKAACDAVGIAAQKFARRQKIVRQRGRLRRLRVRVRRHDGFQMVRRQVEQHRAQLRPRLRDPQQLPPRGHAVQRDGDVVAAARGVHFAGDVAPQASSSRPSMKKNRSSQEPS